MKVLPTLTPAQIHRTTSAGASTALLIAASTGLTLAVDTSVASATPLGPPAPTATSTATFRAGSGNYLTTARGTDNLHQVSGQETFSQTNGGPISVAGHVGGLNPNTVYVTVPYKDGVCVPAAGVTAFPSSAFTTDATGAATFTRTVNPQSINPQGSFFVSQTRSVSIRQVLVNGLQISQLPVAGSPNVPNVGAVEACVRSPQTR